MCCTLSWRHRLELFFSEKYQRHMLPDDVKRVTDRHLEVHGVPGILGSIDCTHFYWKNFPMAWQGHFQGKEKKSYNCNGGCI